MDAKEAGILCEKLNPEVFLSVTETGSFKKTGELLGYTQAGIAYIITTMEESLGFRLFIREYGGVRLTAEGTELLPFFQQLSNSRRILSEKITEISKLETGHVKVLVFDSVFVHWIPGILQEFHKSYPGIGVEFISEENPKKAEEMVLAETVDCGFFLKEVTAPLDVTILMKESLKIVVSKDHPLSGRDSVPVELLSEYPYIEMEYGDDTGIRDIFKRHGVKPGTRYHIDNDYAAVAMAEKGLGFCIFPELLLKDIPYDVKCIDFETPEQRTVSIGTKSRETCSKAAAAFMDFSIDWIMKRNSLKK